MSQRAGLDNTGKPTTDIPLPLSTGHPVSKRFRPAEKDRFLDQVPHSNLFLPFTVYLYLFTPSHSTIKSLYFPLILHRRAHVYFLGDRGTLNGSRTREARMIITIIIIIIIQVTLVYLQKNKLIMYKVSLFYICICI